jgi:hypothetical protein
VEKLQFVDGVGYKMFGLQKKLDGGSSMIKMFTVYATYLGMLLVATAARLQVRKEVGNLTCAESLLVIHW